MTLRRARREVAIKSDRVIERETAQKWAERAMACYERAAMTDGQTHVSWLERGNDYRHEALEHAALVGDYGKTVAKIERKLNGALRKRARKYRRRG